MGSWALRMRQCLYQEKMLYLPNSYQMNDHKQVFFCEICFKELIFAEKMLYLTSGKIDRCLLFRLQIFIAEGASGKSQA